MSELRNRETGTKVWHIEGDRPKIDDIPWDIEELGMTVRDAWVEWARTQPNPKPSWLEHWDLLPPEVQEADIHIAEVMLSTILDVLKELGYK